MLLVLTDLHMTNYYFYQKYRDEVCIHLAKRMIIITTYIYIASLHPFRRKHEVININILYSFPVTEKPSLIKSYGSLPEKLAE